MAKIQMHDLAVINKNHPLDVSALNLTKPFSQEIFLTTTNVAGLQYVRGIKKVAEKLEQNQELKLLRELQNEHDELAVLVKTLDGKKIGYIPRNNNEIIARLMDAGKRIFGKIKTVRFYTEEEQSYCALNIYIDVFMIE